eukprot:894188-Rhodomonas_salina.1
MQPHTLKQHAVRVPPSRLSTPLPTALVGKHSACLASTQHMQLSTAHHHMHASIVAAALNRPPRTRERERTAGDENEKTSL